VLPGVWLELAGDTVPPCAFHVTVTGLTVHRAKYVAPPEGTIVALVTCEPPEEAVNHPLKVWPAWVEVGSVPRVLPGVWLELVGDTVPPCAFHVTVTGLTVH
jgi:hypothetical protein